MSHILLFLLLAAGYVLGAPVPTQSLEFRVVGCISINNDSTAEHVLEVSNVKASCIRINKSSDDGDVILFYMVPATETGTQIRLTTQDCSTPLPEIHLSLCDDEESDPQTMVTFSWINETFVNVATNENGSNSTFNETGTAVYETIHHLDDDLAEDQNGTSIFTTPSFENEENATTLDSSEEGEKHEKIHLDSDYDS